MPGDRWLYAWGLGSVAAGVASLLVPLYAVGLGAGAFELGVLAASAAVVAAPGAVLFGRYADRTGNHRPVVLLALLAVAAALAVLPLLDSVWPVVAANAALWFAFSSVAPVLTMLVVDGVPEAEWTRRIARLNQFQGYGWAAGLVLGSVWTGAAVVRFGSVLAAQRTLFVASAACAVAASLAARRWVPRTAHHVGRTKTGRVAAALARTRRNVREVPFLASTNRLYWSTRYVRPRRLAARFSPPVAAYFAAATLFSTGFAAFWAPLPLYLTDAGLGSEGVFALYLTSSVSSALLYAAAGELGSRYDVRLVQTGALGLRALAFPLVAVLGSAAAVAGPLPLVPVLAVVGGTWAVIAVTQTGIVTRLAPVPVRGEALGAFAALVAVASAAGSLLGGWLATLDYAVAFGVAAALVLVGAALVFALRAISGVAAAASPSGLAD
ncbi:MAG: MFS transporter [Halobacteriaceae archaeon]